MNILEVDALSKVYPIKRGLLNRTVGHVHAVQDVGFFIQGGETLSLVGESGCGKTTVSRCIMRALQPTSGSIRFRAGESLVDIAALPRRALHPLRRHIQMVFQDPNSSLNPRMTVGENIAEPLVVNGVGSSRERERRVKHLLELVRLPQSAYQRFPHAFSGGQRQRIGIARALALNPKLIVADEPVSALDVSVQAQVINLLLDLQGELGLSYLFVAHDLGVVKHMSDRVAVMYVGRIVETGPTRSLFERPRHPYTAALLSAVPRPDPTIEGARAVVQGDVADPADPPKGCPFHPRCMHAIARCGIEQPAIDEIEQGHFVSCHRARELSLKGVSGARPLSPPHTARASLELPPSP